MNRYQHALDTRHIALNDNGLVAWVKHNETAIMAALKSAAVIDDPAKNRHNILNNPQPTRSDTAYCPALDFDAEEHF